MPHDELAAIVLSLRATHALEIRERMGRASQQLALKIMQQHSAALSAAVHDSNTVKPFTASALLWADSTQRVRGTVHAGERAWVRITGLNREIVAALNNYAAHPPGHEEIDNRAWEVEEVASTTAQHRWAGHEDYRDVIDTYWGGPRPERVTFDFASPTTFHSKGLDVPLPLPIFVFRSLIERWNAFAAEPLPAHLLDFVEQFVAVTKYETQTAMLGGKSGSKHTGFIGTVGFSILANNPGLKAHDPVLADTLFEHRDLFSRLVAALGQFAFYSGVGRQTTTGMGMCSVPPISPRS